MLKLFFFYNWPFLFYCTFYNWQFPEHKKVAQGIQCSTLIPLCTLCVSNRYVKNTRNFQKRKRISNKSISNSEWSTWNTSFISGSLCLTWPEWIIFRVLCNFHLVNFSLRCILQALLSRYTQMDGHPTKYYDPLLKLTLLRGSIAQNSDFPYVKSNYIWHMVRAWYVHSNGKQWWQKAAGSIGLCKQNICGRTLSVQRQIKVKIHMSYVITFDIWQSL